MKDFLGNNVKVGDKVIQVTIGSKELGKAVITRITSCFIFTKATDTSRSREVRRTSEQILLYNNDFRSTFNQLASQKND